MPIQMLHEFGYKLCQTPTVPLENLFQGPYPIHINVILDLIQSITISNYQPFELLLY